MIIASARLGERYSTDPLAILAVSETDWVIRIACDKVVQRDREDAEKQRRGNQLTIFD